MSIRLEDRGLTIRLFKDAPDVLSSDLKCPTQYAFGFIGKNEAGRWVDAHGPLPLMWTPDVKLMLTNADESKRFIVETMTGNSLEQWLENNLKVAEIVAGRDSRPHDAGQTAAVRATPKP